MAQAQGFYCSTSDTVFQDREALQQHYNSELHTYNLKRKLAGLPPVTREWFEARKAQLLNQQVEVVERVWFCSLSRKKFGTEKTYDAWTRSKKYLDLVKASGQPAPAPVITLIKKGPKGQAPAEAPVANRQADQVSIAESASTSAPDPRPRAPQGQGFVAKPPVKSYAEEAAARGVQVIKEAKPGAAASDKPTRAAAAAASSEDEDEEEGSEWETASEEDMREYYMEKTALANSSAAIEGEEGEDGAATDSELQHPFGDPSKWEEWNVCRCLFCNQQAADIQASLEHMWKHHGFMVPDAEYLSDIEGLVKYLGLKISAGHVPLYVRGDDPNGKRFRSLHACQRHMIDTNQCKMVYEDNEDEYEDFYDYSALEEEIARRESQLALHPEREVELGVGGYELIIPLGNRQITLGHREFARYYKQRLALSDTRRSVEVGRAVAQYRLMGVDTKVPEVDRAQRMLERKLRNRNNRRQQKMDYMSAKILDLPQYCPY